MRALFLLLAYLIRRTGCLWRQGSDETNWKWVSLQAYDTVRLQSMVLWGISIDPLTSLPNVALISHLIDVLSTQCSTHTNDRVTCCSPTHTLHTKQPNMQWGSALLFIFRLFWIWKNLFLHCVICGRFHFFFSWYVFLHVLGLNWINQYISCYWQIH